MITEELGAPLLRVCALNGAARSTVYARSTAKRNSTDRPGPKTHIDDDTLLEKIRQILRDSPFCGEGYRKVRARLGREHHIRVGGMRVLRLMRQHNLLAPQRARRKGKPRLHEGTIIADVPNMLWGTDGTTTMTTKDGQVWIFAAIDHCTDEVWCHVSKVGDRFAALQPIHDAVIERFGTLKKGIANGIALRHDWGSQYRSHHFFGEITWLGFDDSPAFVREPQTNGVAERFMRTLKEQLLWCQQFDGVDDLRQALESWVATYNHEWLIERNGHRSPKETYAAFASTNAA